MLFHWITAETWQKRETRVALLGEHQDALALTLILASTLTRSAPICVTWRDRCDCVTVTPATTDPHTDRNPNPHPNPNLNPNRAVVVPFGYSLLSG